MEIDQPVFTPQDFLNYLRQNNLMPDFPVPEGVIFCYERSLLRRILENEETEVVDFNAGELHLLKSREGSIGVMARFGYGAPVATTIMEELIALGARKFISVETAGGLQENLNIGDIIVCRRAVRDEGVSGHYLEPKKYAFPSRSLTQELKNQLIRRRVSFREGTSWTTDTPYRETVGQVIGHQEEGVLTVEMEAAALFAVAEYRQVDIAASFVVSDLLTDFQWRPGFKSTQYVDNLEKLYLAAVTTLIP